MMIRILIVHLVFGTAAIAQKANQIRLPILHMKFVDWVAPHSLYDQLKDAAKLQLANKGVAMHLADKEPQKYSIESLYNTQVKRSWTVFYTDYIQGNNPDPSAFRDIDYNWSFLIPESYLNSTLLGMDTDNYLFGQLQEIMLKIITEKMVIQLSKVAQRLGVPERNLSYSYDPSKWEEVVHAMVEEGILNYLTYLNVVNEDKLASLFGLTTSQLKNSTIEAFIAYLPPIKLKKELIDKNKTKDFLNFLGISAVSSDAVIYNLINQTTNLTVSQFGILYNLTVEQQRITERATLLQISQSCSVEMSLLLDKLIFKLVWDIVGDSNSRSVSCWFILKVKGVAINSLPGLADRASKTPLQLLLHACNGSYWKSCRLTMTLGPSEWECLDSMSLTSAASTVGISEANLLNSPVNDVATALNAKCKSGGVSLTRYRSALKDTLESLFNLTLTEVENSLGISNAQSFTGPQFIQAFLNTTSKDFGISLDTMYNTSTKTLQEFYDSPIYEVYEYIPFIITSAVAKPASQLRMSVADTLFILKLSAKTATIAQYKYAHKYVLPGIITSKNKFENETLGDLLSALSMNDNVALESSILELLLNGSGFDLQTMKTIYGMSDDQVSVLQLLMVKNMNKYCGLDLANIKKKTCFNITALLVGINEINATCKATNFYVAARAITVGNLESMCPIVASESTSLLKIIEQCSGLTWRFNAGMLGVQLKDWPQMDVLNRVTLSTHSDLNADKIKVSKFVSLLTKANQVHETKVSYKQDLAKYTAEMRQQLYTTFSTTSQDVSEVLLINTAYLESLTLLETVEKVQDFLKKKYTITLSNTASSLNVLIGNLKYLAPSEWNEMMPSLKTEIISSGSSQLQVTEINFQRLLQISDVPSLNFVDLERSWDTDYKRLLKGKTFAENKTMSDIQSQINISLETLRGKTLLGFYNDHLNLTKADISILFRMAFQELDVLTKFTMKELPCSCKFSESHLLSLKPNAILSSMVGKGDLVSCRPIAVLDGLYSLSIDSLEAKFNITFNATKPLLDVVQSLSDLPFEKISWGLDIKLSDWPLFSAVSLEVFGTTNSTILATLKSIPFRNVTALIINDKNKFSSQLQTLHSSLLAQASREFSLSSAVVCGKCEIPSNDVLRTFLDHLGGAIYLDPSTIPPVDGFDCIAHDLFMLPPSKWHLLVTGIIPQSFKNISVGVLQSTENQLEHILGTSQSTIFNMTLTQYLQLISTRVRPMVECFHSIHNDNAWTKVSAAGKGVSFMKTQTVLQTISLMCKDVNVYNMSVLMGWKALNLSILQNTTLEDAAVCKRMSIQSILSRNALALANMMIREIYGCNVIPCPSGTLQHDLYYNCSDVNECQINPPVCEAKQECQNYFGGYECDCTEPGYCLAGKVCDKCLRYSLIIVFDAQFTTGLNNPLSFEFFVFIDKVKKLVTSTLIAIPEFRECRVEKLSKGSVRAELSIYTSTGYKGNAADLEKHFRDKLNSTKGQKYLGDLKVMSETLTDYNECSKNQVNCDQHATCVNNEGTFSCKCNSGYEGNGVECEAGFLKTYWWLVVVLAVVLLIIIIVIIVLVVKKPQLKSFRVDDKEPKSTMKRSDSNLSYKSGDVYYKDKYGNVRRGSQHAQDSAEPRNPIYGKEIPENVYDNNDSRWTNNIYALDNLGAEKPRDEESIEIEMTSTFDEETPKQNGMTMDDKIL